MTRTLSLRWQPQLLPVFNEVVARFDASPLSFTEAEALKPDFWDAGEDARLREDERFSPTPWGRWTLHDRTLINDQLFARLQATPEARLTLAEVVPGHRSEEGRQFVFCPGDPRFVLSGNMVRLAYQRDLTSTEGRERIATRLHEIRKRIFEQTRISSEAGVSPVTTGWDSTFVCLEAEAGGLHLEAGPLDMPRAVRALEIRAGERSWTVLASNFRSRCWRVPVSPCTGTFRWSAPGHEDLLGEDLAHLEQPGLPPETAAVFRVDAQGIGRRLVGTCLTPGQTYRLLIPPSLSFIELCSGMVANLDDGWRLWELTLPVPCETALLEILRRLGLEADVSALHASWVITPPNRYLETPREESFPCFTKDTTPILAVRSETTTSEGELSLFLLAGSDLQTLALPPGEDWLVQLADLSPGRYVLDVLHRSTRFEPLHLAFAIEERSGGALPTRVTVRQGEEVLTVDGEGRLAIEADLSDLGSEELSIEAPPLWPVEVTWDEGRRVRLGILHASAEGQLDMVDLLTRTRERRQRSCLGDLVLDFAELGRVVLRHSRQVTGDELQHQLQQFVVERSSTLAGLAGQLSLVRSLWLEPLLGLLGYTIEEPLLDQVTVRPSGTLVLLLHVLRRETGQIRRRLRCVLLLAPIGTGLEDATLRGEVDQICERCEVFEAILTDGLMWSLHRPGKRRRSTARDIRDLLGPRASQAFEDFWFEFGA